jgi:hypothetical protein
VGPTGFVAQHPAREPVTKRMWAQFQFGYIL